MYQENSRKVGFDKEEVAAEYLLQHGFRIKERNFISKRGEIDIIGYDGEYLVFVEVKYRGKTALCNPLATVGGEKQKRICRTADFYRYQRKIGQEIPVRYDVIGIWEEKIEWIKNAFPHRFCR